MGSSRLSRWGLSLLLLCCLVAGSVAVAAVAVGSGFAAVQSPGTLTTDVVVDDVTQELDDGVSLTDETTDSTPTEDAQTTATPTPEETATPTPTAEDDSSSTPTSTPTPSESESGTPTSTATPTPAETPGTDDANGDPSTTDDSDDGASGSEGSGGDSGGADGDGADESSGQNSAHADAGSRDPSDFEDAAGNETADPDGPGVPNATGAEPGDDAPAVEARSRQRMPARGPTNGTIVMSFDDVPVSTISFTRRQYGDVTVDVLAGIPSGVEAPAGDRLSTLRITVPEEVRDSPAKVMFTVDVATLEARGIPNDAVWLAHHRPETGTWDRLETHVVRASDERIVYAANTPGFSLFAIRGDSGQVRSVVPVEAENDSGGTNDTATDEAEATFLGGFGFPMGIVLFMGAVSVGTTVFGARRVSSVEVDGRNDS